MCMGSAGSFPGILPAWSHYFSVAPFYFCAVATSLFADVVWCGAGGGGELNMRRAFVASGRPDSSAVFVPSGAAGRGAVVSHGSERTATCVHAACGATYSSRAQDMRCIPLPFPVVRHFRTLLRRSLLRWWLLHLWCSRCAVTLFLPTPGSTFPDEPLPLVFHTRIYLPPFFVYCRIPVYRLRTGWTGEG